jgi:hypothetical protein
MAIRGAITTKDLFTNSVVILRHFGPRAWLRCWFAIVLHRETTFLACVVCLRGA